MESTRGPRSAAESEAQLVRQAQAGDQSALGALLKGQAATVERICRSMCADAVQYEDLLQETYIGILQSFRSFRCEAAFSTWAYTIARTQYLRQHRRGRRTGRPSAEAAVPDRQAPARTQPELRLAGDEIGTAIDRALASLTPVDRSVMTSFYLQQRSLREVAGCLGLSEAAAKSRLYRARAAVRRRLQTLRTELEPDHDEQAIDSSVGA